MPGPATGMFPVNLISHSQSVSHFHLVLLACFVVHPNQAPHRHQVSDVEGVIVSRPDLGFLKAGRLERRNF